MNEDQGNASEEKTSEESTEETKVDNTEKSNSEDKTQSNEVEEGQAQKRYKDTFGNELTAEELYDTYNKIVPNYTRMSQELAELKKASKQNEEQAGEDARKAIGDNKLLKDVPPDVKEAIVSIVTPVIQDAFKQREVAKTEEEKGKAFENELSSLESKYQGKDGLPKFDKNKVLAKMKETGNRIYDPEVLFLKMNEKAINDRLIKQALKQQRGGTRTEETGRESSRKPESKAPKDFEQASKHFLSRIKE